jgi:hypothetical protein
MSTFSFEVMARVASSRVVALTAVLAIAACKGPLSTPAEYTFDGTFAFTFSNSDSASHQNGVTVDQGGMILSVNGVTGAFQGTYMYVGGSSGTISGTFHQGGTLSITQFGDPHQALGATIQYLQTTWPNCDFTRATATAFAGTAVNGALTLNGGLSVECAYGQGQQQIAVPTTLTEQVRVQQVTANGTVF